MATHAAAARAGTFRSHRLRDGFVDYVRFRKTPHYRLFYESLGVTDRIWVVFPLNAGAESYFLFDRTDGARRFSKRDAEVAAYALRGLRWFHLRLFLGRGLLVGETPLSEVQRPVVHALLTGKEERHIARELGLSSAMAHKRIIEIYRIFGVTSRAALMALWLGGR